MTSPLAKRRLERRIRNFRPRGRIAVLHAPKIGIIHKGSYTECALLLMSRTLAGATVPGETILRLPRKVRR
jgi:hypothetical protein